MLYTNSSSEFMTHKKRMNCKILLNNFKAVAAVYLVNAFKISECSFRFLSWMPKPGKRMDSVQQQKTTLIALTRFISFQNHCLASKK
jgi:hypothetical protein